MRDPSLLLSALARPRNRAAYGEPDLADLAATYAVGIIRNHPFFDGNKRTGLVVAFTFLYKNGYSVQPDPRDAVHTILAVADGKLPEDALAQWLRAYMRPLPNE